jgi:hypothetical protein
LNFVELSDSTMPSAKSEIVLKFSELPQAKPLPDKKVGVELTDQNGIAFTAILNAKSWRKAEANAAGFEMWAGAISGKLGKGSQGLEIVDAGIDKHKRLLLPVSLPEGDAHAFDATLVLTSGREIPISILSRREAPPTN